MDAWHNAAAAKTAPQQSQPQVTFDDLLKKAGQVAGASQGALSSSQINALGNSLLQTPEMQSALIGSGTSQQCTVTIAADGSVSVAKAGGASRNLVLSPGTQALALQLRQALGASSQDGLILQAGGGTAGASAGAMPNVVFQGI